MHVLSPVTRFDVEGIDDVKILLATENGGNFVDNAVTVNDIELSEGNANMCVDRKRQTIQRDVGQEDYVEVICLALCWHGILVDCCLVKPIEILALETVIVSVESFLEGSPDYASGYAISWIQQD